MPRMLLGPRTRDGSILPLPLEAMPTTEDPSIGIQLDVELVKEILLPWSGHARAVLLAMLKGANVQIAAAKAGIGGSTLEGWMQSDREFAEACKEAQGLGFSVVFESELYRRAVAGDSDRGSARLLEVVLKSRNPTYREKYSADIHVMHTAMDRMDGLAGRYSAGPIVDGVARELLPDEGEENGVAHGPASLAQLNEPSEPYTTQ